VKDLPSGLAEYACIDVYSAFEEHLLLLTPIVVINTCGPFQSSDYSVTECCIKHRTHYTDLADGRSFVVEIEQLNQLALDNKVSVISGASTVPGLSSAVVEDYQSEFKTIDVFTFGISPGQQAERGLATTQGILSYVGKPLKPPAGSGSVRYGWQSIYRQRYPVLGKRWMANCDIPDLDLLPSRYGIKEIKFSAGLELAFMHLGLWGLSWLVRLGFPLKLDAMAKPLLAISILFDHFGSADGGMHILISGKDFKGSPLTRSWFIVALDGYGPYIPTVPAIVLAKKLFNGDYVPSGALPYVGLVSLSGYLDELRDYPISTYTNTDDA